MKNYEKLKQIIQETNSKKIKKWNKCVCGHYDRDHDDIGVFNNWGAGKCNVCSCKKLYLKKKILALSVLKIYYWLFRNKRKIIKISGLTRVRLVYWRNSLNYYLQIKLNGI